MREQACVGLTRWRDHMINVVPCALSVHVKMGVDSDMGVYRALFCDKLGNIGSF